MGKHDTSYKRLFSHPRMMEDFLRAFVREPWVADLDFSTLEKMGSDFVSEKGDTRDGDVVWRVSFRGDWLYVCVLLEFQSKVDPRMALRMLVYVGLFYQELIRRGLVKRGQKLPPVLPVVLYNGKPEWDAPRDLWDLIAAVPAGLERYQPRMQYFLLDEGRLAESELSSLQNLSAALFRLERSHGEEEITRVTDAMAEVLEDPELQSLEEAFADWIRQVLLPARAPGIEVPKLKTMKEVRTMLAERVKEWPKEWKEEGRQEGIEQGIKQGLEQGRQQGRQEGRQQGRQQGRREGLELGRREGLEQGRQGLFEVALGLLERRFGPLDQETRQSLEARSMEELIRLAQDIPTASSLHELGLT